MRSTMAYDLWLDVRYSLRRLAAQPGYTIVMVATLALAIGATTAVYTVVDETLLRPAPFAFADRLVDVMDVHRGNGGGGSSLSPEKIVGWQSSPLFERLEGYSPRQFDIVGGRAGACVRPHRHDGVVSDARRAARAGTELRR